MNCSINYESTTALVLYTDSGKVRYFWTCPTKRSKNIAFECLFRELDQRGTYDTLVQGPTYGMVMAARAGDIRHIKSLLTTRNGIPGETWELVVGFNTEKGSGWATTAYGVQPDSVPSAVVLSAGIVRDTKVTDLTDRNSTLTLKEVGIQ